MTDASKFLDTARRVIRIEADALALLANEVGTPFGQAVQLRFHNLQLLINFKANFTRYWNNFNL